MMNDSRRPGRSDSWENRSERSGSRQQLTTGNDPLTKKSRIGRIHAAERKRSSRTGLWFCRGGLWPGGFWHTIAVRKEMQNVPRMPGRCPNETTAEKTGRIEENKGVQET